MLLQSNRRGDGVDGGVDVFHVFSDGDNSDLPVTAIVVAVVDDVVVMKEEETLLSSFTIPLIPLSPSK